MSISRTAVAVLVTLVASVSVGSVGSAQERLEVFTTIDAFTGIVEVDATVSGFGRVRNVTPIPPLLFDFTWAGPTPLAGGRFIVWGPLLAPGLVVFDRRTRAILQTGYRGSGASTDLIADPVRPLLFVRGDTAITMIDARDLSPRVVYQLATGETITAVAPASEAGLIFVGVSDFRGGPASHRIDVVDLVTGATVRQLPRPDYTASLEASSDGNRLWALTRVLFSIGNLFALDPQTGANLGAAPFLSPAFSVDRARNLVLVTDYFGEYLRALDGDTLAERWRTRVDLPVSLRGHRSATQALEGRWMTGAYGVHMEERGDGVCQDVSIAAISPDGSRRDVVDLQRAIGRSGVGCWAFGVTERSPFPPAGFAATVTGDTVALSWRDPGDVTEFELEFGFAPGQRVGALRLGAAPAITFPGVPPGTYYLRVKAVNEVGASPASNEIRVNVR